MVWPGLRYDDAPAAIRFLTEVFGFTEMLVVPGENGAVAHAELAWPDGGAVMLGSNSHTQGVHEPTPPGTSSTYVVSVDAAGVDAVYQRVKNARVAVIADLHDTDYGSHGFTCRDPEGNMWTFGTYRGA